MHTRHSHGVPAGTVVVVDAGEQPVAAHMSRPVVVEHGDSTPKAALKVLLQSGQRDLAVVGSHGTFLGIVSATAIANARGATLSCLVGSPALHVPVGSCIRAATSLMLTHGVDVVGVLDKDGAVVGILRWTDIIEMVGGRERP